MAFNILDLAKGYLTDAVISKVAGGINEDSSLVSKAIGMALPALMGGILQKGSSDTGLSSLMGLLTNNTNTSVLDNLGSVLGDKNQSEDLMVGGSSLISSLLGNNSNSIMNAVGSFVGMKNTSTSSIFSLLAPVVMGILGKKVKSDGLGLSGLSSLLSSQKDIVSSALPTGLASTLGFGNMLSSGASKVSAAANSVESEVKSKNWMPLILGALAILAALFFWRSCGSDVKEAATDAKDSAIAVTDSATSVVENSASAVQDGLASLGAFFKRKLPNGMELNIPEMGVENNLIKFLDDASAPISTDKWLNFDRINFATGSSNLTEESMDQVSNISEILKAYPNVKMKIGGYTDNTGNAQGNLKLSDSRAKAVMAAIVAKGIEASRLSAEGYGDQHPVASNDTEEGRAQNRRIAVRVDAK